MQNINLSINKGEFVAIVGPSGSGKSTLLHLIGGVDKPTSGKVYINNVDIYSLKEETEYDPYEMQEIERRLDTIFTMKRKYGNSI